VKKYTDKQTFGAHIRIPTRNNYIENHSSLQVHKLYTPLAALVLFQLLAGNPKVIFILTDGPGIELKPGYLH
jgi:hypothetical protein